jgi:hypothetical protein
VDIQARLEEIRSTSLQSLSEGEVLALLKERTSLEESLRQEEREKEAEAERLAEVERAAESQKKQEALKNELKEKIAELRAAIHPDQSDEELIRIITERKELETALRSLEEESESLLETKEPVVELAEEKQEEPETLVEESLPEATLPEDVEIQVTAETQTQPEPEVAAEEKITIDTRITHREGHVGQSGKISELDGEGERFKLDTALNTGEYQGYLSELKANSNSLGSFLQNLPAGAKRSKAFMLEVAKIDPAYAMHYADKDTLKKDEDFNVRIAGMNNNRNTGNPISEMLPEMRTSAVILVGVKNDFRNVRFLLPEMPDYEAILALAQKGALESLKTLKNAHDIEFLIPPILQKDKKFMEEVEKVTSTTLAS